MISKYVAEKKNFAADCSDCSFFCNFSSRNYENSLKLRFISYKTADLMMYMGYDTSYWGTIGIAWGKVVCQHSGYNKYKESINEWRKTHAEAGVVRNLTFSI